MKRGFTLLELLTVIGMLAVLGASMGAVVSSARRRSLITRATVDVREITNAILAYEHWDENHRIKEISDQEASVSTLEFILGGKNGEGYSSGGRKVPVLYNAAVTGERILDPWGTPYRVRVVKTADTKVVDKVASGEMPIFVYLPNSYRLSEDER